VSEQTRTKYADSKDKAPVIDCSRAGFFKVRSSLLSLSEVDSRKNMQGISLLYQIIHLCLESEIA
jgi:hypothetical protein